MNLGPILIGLPGTELDEPGRKQLCHPAVGGVVLFTRNFSSQEQLDQLIAEVRSLREPRLFLDFPWNGKVASNGFASAIRSCKA